MPSKLAFTHHLIAAAVLLSFAGGAWAQAAEAGKLQTVTVTAERRTENIRDVPNSGPNEAPVPWPEALRTKAHPNRRSWPFERSRSHPNTGSASAIWR